MPLSLVCALCLFCGLEMQCLLLFSVPVLACGLIFFLGSDAGFESLVGGIYSLCMPPSLRQYAEYVFYGLFNICDGFSQLSTIYITAYIFITWPILWNL